MAISSQIIEFDDDSSSIDPREPMLCKESNMVDMKNTKRHMSLRLPPMLEFNNHHQTHHLRYTPVRRRIRAARFNHHECMNDDDGDGTYNSKDNHTLVEGSSFGKLLHKSKVSQKSNVLDGALMDVHGECIEEEGEGKGREKGNQNLM